MRFKFLGKKTLIVDTFTPHKVYNFIQFEHYNGFICAYFIDDNKEVTCIPYKTMDTFNANWKAMSND